MLALRMITEYTIVILAATEYWVAFDATPKTKPLVRPPSFHEKPFIGPSHSGFGNGRGPGLHQLGGLENVLTEKVL